MDEDEKGPDLAAELKALRKELDAERAARKADSEKATRDLLSFASMRQAPAPTPTGPQPPREIDWDSLPDPDDDRRKYDRALEAERRRFDRETREFERAQSAPPAMNHGKRVYDMVKKQLPNADEDDLNYIAGRVAAQNPDIQTYAAHFGDKLVEEIVGKYNEKFGKAQAPAPRSEPEEASVFGGIVDAPLPAAPGDEELGSLSGDLQKMQRKAKWDW